MPKPVDKVPDLWEPYKDGQIWEFTEDEIRALPNWQPMHNSLDGNLIGPRKIQWYVSGRYFVRFVREEDMMTADWLDRAAGWVD